MTAPTVPKHKILLVDDEPAIIVNLAPFLERVGFEVITAANGQEALNKGAAVWQEAVKRSIKSAGRLSGTVTGRSK